MTVAPTRVPATGKALQGLSTPSAGLRKRDVKPEDFRHCFTSSAWLGAGNTLGHAFSTRSPAFPLPWHRKGGRYGVRDTWRLRLACPLTWCPGLDGGGGVALPVLLQVRDQHYLPKVPNSGAAGGTFVQGLTQLPSPVSPRAPVGVELIPSIIQQSGTGVAAVKLLPNYCSWEAGEATSMSSTRD